MNREWSDRHRRYFNLTVKHFQPTVGEKTAADGSIGGTFRIGPNFCEIGNEPIMPNRQVLYGEYLFQVAKFRPKALTIRPGTKKVKFLAAVHSW